MWLKNIKKISLLVAISTALTSVSVNAASLEKIISMNEAEITELATYKATNNDSFKNINYHVHPIEYTDENGNYILEYNQFKIIKGNGEKYSTVSFNEGLTSISQVIDPDMDIAFFDVVGNVVIPDTVTTISSNNVNGRSDVLNSFGFNAFQNNELKKYPVTLHLSDSLTEIPDYLCDFSSFTGVLNIPKSVKKIGINSFQTCDFDLITIPKNVESIAYGGLKQPSENWHDVFFEGDFLNSYDSNLFETGSIRVHYPKAASGFNRINKRYWDDAKEDNVILIPYEGTLEEALAEHEEQKRKDEEALKNGIYSDTISVNGYDISFSTHCIYTGKKIKLDTITVSDPNGKVFSDKQVKVRYKNNKNASRVNKDQASATFMITGVKGDKEANKAIKAALKKQWVNFTIYPRNLSNEKLIISWKKNGYDIRKVCYTLNGKKKTVPKKMWDYFDFLKFSKNFTGEYSLSGNNAE